MDESWDADFDGEIRVPDSVRDVSDYVRTESISARQLSVIVAQLKRQLTRTIPDVDEDVLSRAVALVQASTENANDPFYSSDTWNQCKDQPLAVEGSSIEEILKGAQQIEADINASER